MSPLQIPTPAQLPPFPLSPPAPPSASLLPPSRRHPLPTSHQRPRPPTHLRSNPRHRPRRLHRIHKRILHRTRHILLPPPCPKHAIRPASWHLSQVLRWHRDTRDKTCLPPGQRAGVRGPRARDPRWDGGGGVHAGRRGEGGRECGDCCEGVGEGEGRLGSLEGRRVVDEGEHLDEEVVDVWVRCVAEVVDFPGGDLDFAVGVEERERSGVGEAADAVDEWDFWGGC